MIESSNEGSRCRPGRRVGFLFIFLSVFSILISLGMPGVGWVTGALVLIVARLMAPLIGKWMVGIIVVISFIHLITLGPVADFQIQPGVDLAFATFTVVVPFVVGLSVFLSKR